MIMIWNIKPFAELTVDELYRILQARCAVFIVEQSCPYLDADGLDTDSIHLFAEEDNELAAYCRITPKGTRFPEMSIGRVITPARYRGTGLGRELMARSIRYVTKELGEPAIRISGQSYLRRFYESFGFTVCSEEYLEDGIPHLELLYTTLEKEL